MFFFGQLVGHGFFGMVCWTFLGGFKICHDELLFFLGLRYLVRSTMSGRGPKETFVIYSIHVI